MSQCTFRLAGPTGSQCRQPGTHRVHYCVDPETEMTPDHRLYCRKHAEQYAAGLNRMACITAVEVREETCAR